MIENRESNFEKSDKKSNFLKNDLIDHRLIERKIETVIFSLLRGNGIFYFSSLCFTLLFTLSVCLACFANFFLIFFLNSVNCTWNLLTICCKFFVNFLNNNLVFIFYLKFIHNFFKILQKFLNFSQNFIQSSRSLDSRWILHKICEGVARIPLKIFIIFSAFFSTFLNTWLNFSPHFINFFLRFHKSSSNISYDFDNFFTGILKITEKFSKIFSTFLKIYCKISSRLDKISPLTTSKFCQSFRKIFLKLITDFFQILF